MREREKWLKLWRPLSRLLVDRRHAVVLDIVFHVELDTLPDEFVVDELIGKLPFVESYPNHVVCNDIWDVKIRPVGLERAAAHLSQYNVKCPSDQMIELIGGRRDPNRGFTCVYGGRTATMGTGHVFDRFVDSIDFAAGAFWHCDAIRSIEKKARDIRAHLAGAVRQRGQSNGTLSVRLPSGGIDIEYSNSHVFKSAFVNMLRCFRVITKNMMYLLGFIARSDIDPFTPDVIVTFSLTSRPSARKTMRDALPSSIPKWLPLLYAYILKLSAVESDTPTKISSFLGVTHCIASSMGGIPKVNTETSATIRARAELPKLMCRRKSW